MNKQDVLGHYFGYSAFRPGQEGLIDAILAGRDVLGIMPTGGGKSICYQVPAMLLDGVTIVISPLISLMQDQVMALRSVGIPAAYINSTLSPAQMARVTENLIGGRYRIVYVAPERLETNEFHRIAARLNIALFAVDEAHCISQWGQDFRPSYLKIVSFLDSLPHRPPVAAFTATATEIVRDDMIRLLALRNPVTVLTGFDRPNLHFSVLSGSKKGQMLLELLREQTGKSGIVYCATRSSVERVCTALNAAGFAATRYHAGLDDAERRENQEDFLYDRRPIMVATNAFGMGIDKSNVSFVIHYNMPLSLEAYYQEAGRAGRDGEPASCILLFAQSDIRTASMLLQGGNENEALTSEERAVRLKQNYARLDKMIGYCRTTACLRGYILSYFGQAHEEKCGNCGNCAATFREEDVTVEAQKILSCVRRAQAHLGYPIGKMLIARILRASRDHRIEDLGLNTLSTYGLLKDLSRARVNALIDSLEEQGYLTVSLAHGGTELTAKASEILFEGARFAVTLKDAEDGDASSEKKTKGRKSQKSPAPASDLYDALRRLRTEIALEESVPAYIVFTNATLADMAEKRPRTLPEFLNVSGVGKAKAQRYAERFLRVIRDAGNA